jgi:hypothetical protein
MQYKLTFLLSKNSKQLKRIKKSTKIIATSEQAIKTKGNTCNKYIKISAIFKSKDADNFIRKK